MANNEEKAQKKSAKAPKKNVFKSLKAEFAKIVWPTRDTVRKETISVTAATVFLSLLIAVLDAVIKLGIEKIAAIGA